MLSFQSFFFLLFFSLTILEFLHLLVFFGFVQEVFSIFDFLSFRQENKAFLHSLQDFFKNFGRLLNCAYLGGCIVLGDLVKSKLEIHSQSWSFVMYWLLLNGLL
jgi:hypothetical protein